METNFRDNICKELKKFCADNLSNGEDALDTIEHGEALAEIFLDENPEFNKYIKEEIGTDPIEFIKNRLV